MVKGDISIDTFSIKKEKFEILIFYKNEKIQKKYKNYFLSEDTLCNKEVFLKKLSVILHQSAMFNKVCLKLYNLPLDKTIYFKDKNNNKAPISNLTALIYGFDSYFFENETDVIEHLEILNDIASNNVNSYSKLIVKSTFEFGSKIRKQDKKNIILPKHLYILAKDSINMNVSCEALDVPEEDIFLEHLTLLFKPNLVMNRIIKISRKNKNGLIIDSLIHVLGNQKNEIEKLKNQKKSNNNRVYLSSHYSLFNFGSSSNNLSSNLKTGFVNRFEISYSRTFSSGFGVGISLNNLNANGTINTTELEVEHQEVLPSSTVVINKKTNIINLTEYWSLDNAIGLNLGLNFKKEIGKKEKVNLFIDIELGKILNSNIRTTLQEGVFNYRASIPGIEDEIFNIASLDLKENVTYSEKFNQKFGFKGSSFSICTAVEYSFYKKIFVKGGFQFEYYRLKNTDYNSESKVSTSLGDFNSSFNNVKSMTLLPFSIGLGVGIKF